ncbi:Aste57867_2468 [Aphanomyces stellatus]|uniref:Aste57867_2468 protein n=1 Tax=Aphanomyces stellatus TaxID=120398 RepID=A0A485K8Q8_9STRA|nr:hypothetical protein As57867_002462 [Aphanomyces stellatus]VFT79668.1 Aste57867_2468 [Aphanomyces stellatus]
MPNSPPPTPSDRVKKPPLRSSPLLVILSFVAALNFSALVVIHTSPSAYMAPTSSSPDTSTPLHVHWGHAVNSKALLASALANNLAIEADVLLNSLNIPVMAHPPAVDSDLTLADLLSSVEFTSTCIVKLDFKTYDAFHASLPLISQFDAAQKDRIWINADILRGSFAPESRFPAAQFIEEAKACGAGKLSVGWTTSKESAEYSHAMVDEMLALLAPHAVAATFPIKASLVRGSWDALRKLYANPANGITLWLNDPMTDEDLEWLHSTLEESDEVLRGRTYYDLQGWNALVQRKGW